MEEELYKVLGKALKGMRELRIELKKTKQELVVVQDEIDEIYGV